MNACLPARLRLPLSPASCPLPPASCQLSVLPGPGSLARPAANCRLPAGWRFNRRFSSGAACLNKQVDLGALRTAVDILAITRHPTGGWRSVISAAGQQLPSVAFVFCVVCGGGGTAACCSCSCRRSCIPPSSRHCATANGPCSGWLRRHGGHRTPPSGAASVQVLGKYTASTRPGLVVSEAVESR
jgi:hypothetical protein